MKSSNSRQFILIPGIILFIILIAGSACAKAQAPQAEAPHLQVGQQMQTNQSPVISSLTAANSQLYPSATTDVQIVASDPNGASVSISWQCTGGTIIGQGYAVKWQAPQNYGTYTITAIASNDKGASAQQSITMTVGAIQSPQIASIVANPQTLAYGQQTLISCTASDPGGDTLTYTWTTDQGSLSGQGPSVTWNAPGKDGVFKVYVTVTNTKGGQAKGEVTITVAGTVQSMTLALIPKESGTVNSSNRADGSIFRSGDDGNNSGLRAFFSFNVSSLKGAQIKDAKLVFSGGKIVGDPFLPGGAMSLNGLWIKQIQYEGGIPYFNIVGTALTKADAGFFELPDSVDVTPEIAYGANYSSNSFRVMAAFDKISNSNNTADWVEWTDVKLQVSYVSK